MLTRPNGRPERQRRSEQGSVALAMVVLMVLTLLGMAVIARSQSDLRATASDSEELAARGGAEQGLAEALGRIVAGERSDFSGSGSLPDGTYRYEATALDGRSFEIYAESEIDGVRRAVIGTVGGAERYRHSLFVTSSASFDDNLGRIDGVVGSNGPLRISGSVPGDRHELFGPAADCTACPSPTRFDDALELPSPSPPDAADVPGGRFQTCPSDGVFSGVVSGRGGQPFVCSIADVTGGIVSFDGLVAVTDGPLIIHVADDLDVALTDATVNAGGDATDLQLFLAGDGGRARVEMQNSRIDGVVYAPGRILDGDGMAIVGSLTIGEVIIERGESFSIAAANELAVFEVSGWQLSSWSVVPVR